MKLLTQIGLTYLKPRTVSWAYKKKKQSLLTNLSKNIQKVTIQTNTGVFQAKKLVKKVNKKLMNVILITIEM